MGKALARRAPLALSVAAVAVAAVLVAPGQLAHAAGGCSSTGPGGDWPSFGHDLANTRDQASEATISASNVLTLKRAWVFRPTDGGASGFNSTATESGGCVFVGSAAGWVYALDVNTGAVVWKTQLTVPAPGLGGAIVSAVNISGGRAYVLANNTADGAGSGPYAVALDQHSGAIVWTSPPLDTHKGDYTNASPVITPTGLVIAGFSPQESDSTGTGGVALIDAATGGLVKRVYTIPADRQAQGFSGGGIWTNPAVDAQGYAYAGTGNPFSKTKQDPNTNAIIKIDVNPSRATFGTIVGSSPGNIDQYTELLKVLADSPLCAQTAKLFDTSFLDDPVCGQLDLDFGASPNLFTVNGRQIVGDLQKAGVYHAVDTATMTKKWARIVGTPCQFCNADATATFGSRIFGEATLGGLAFSINQSNGGYRWISPVLDAIHYQSFSIANNLVYTVDSLGFLDIFNASNGLLLLRRPMGADAHTFVLSASSTGVAIARNHVIATTGPFSEPGVPLPTAGYVVAYTR